MSNDSHMALKGHIAVVTGAGRGIGAAIARRLAELGSRVVLCGRSRQSLETTAAAIAKRGGLTEVAECDVTSLASIEKLAAELARKYGAVHILVNNAGVGDFQGPLYRMSAEAWDRVLNTNLRGVFYCVKAFTPLLMKAGEGHIINISSLVGKNALPNGAAYSASKWGLNGLTYSLAEELRGNNIRVAVVCPGSVATEFSPHTGRDPQKLLQPDDVAHAVAMLVTQAPQSFMSEILLRPTQKP